MQFSVVCRDGQNALSKRLAAREEHIKLGDKMVSEKKMLFGAAILNDEKQMVGSILICEFDSREELDEWLKIEPYVTQGVWEDVDVHECKIGPSFQHMFSSV